MSTSTQNNKNILYATVTIIMVLLSMFTIYFGIRYIKKNISYKFYYQEMVQDTVRSMVKPEALKQ